MEAGNLPFLDDEHEDDAAEIEAVEAETEASEAPEAQADEAEAQSESKGESEAAPPAASEEKQSDHIPLTALLDEREKRQQAQRELEELRRWKAQQEAQRQQQRPDFFENPEAVLQQERQQFQQALVAEKLKQSRFLAEREFGAETVQAAFELFNDPKHAPKSHELLNEPSPFHAAVEYYKQQKTLQEIGSDPEAWRKQQEEALRAQIRAELEAELAQKKPAAPPRSLASAPSAGGETPSAGSAFDELFGG